MGTIFGTGCLALGFFVLALAVALGTGGRATAGASPPIATLPVGTMGGGGMTGGIAPAGVAVTSGET